MRLWYLRRGVPWAAVAGCLVVAAVLAAAARHWPSYAELLLPFTVAAGGAAAGFVLDEDGAALVGSTPRGGRWADASRLATLPVIALLLVVLVRPASTAAGLSPPGWSVVALVAVALGVAVARLLRPRLPSPGTHVAVLLVVLTAAPFVVGGLLDWPPPWPAAELSGARALLWGGLGATAVVVLGWGLFRGDPRARGRSASMGA